MNLLPKSHEEFSKKEYWDEFFQKIGSKAFEWYGEYPELSIYLHKYIKTKDNVLVVGCGNSTLSSDLFDIGYNNITSIDVSKVVIRQMLNLHQKIRPDLKFLQMDAMNMTFEDNTFSVAVDKGTLDALMPNDNSDVVEKIQKYFKEIERVLKVGGRYICISLLQEHILKALIDYFPYNNWMFRVVRCFEAEKKTEEKGEKVLPVFLVVCTKFKNLPEQILEVNATSSDQMQRLSSTKEIVDTIFNIQKAAFVCSALKKTFTKEYNEVLLDLFRPGDSSPRFTVFIVNVVFDRKKPHYAAFIVPQGREVEWMFSTKDGRKHLAEITNYNRLAIITLHREHKYGDLEAVKTELESTVQSLAPGNMTGKILFLSIGSDVGRRVVRYEGQSELSGKYVVEDVEIDEKEKYRRLIFMKNQNVIQSEARLKHSKSRKGHTKEVIDHLHLASLYHVYMTLGCSLICEQKPLPRIAVIGLGGGSLCIFLRKFLSSCEITAIDIDPEVLQIARNWFGLELDEKLNVVVSDGLDFLKDAASNKKKYDCLIFDVDSKDASMGVSCPPKEFLEAHVIKDVVKSIKDDGLFILNLVLRNKVLRPGIMELLKENFECITSYQMEEDLNEVIFCFKEKKDPDKHKVSLGESCKKLQQFLKKGKQMDDIVKIDNYLSKLIIEK